MKYKIYDKKNKYYLDASKYGITQYGDVICYSSGMVLLDGSDFDIQQQYDPEAKENIDIYLKMADLLESKAMEYADMIMEFRHKDGKALSGWHAEAVNLCDTDCTVTMKRNTHETPAYEYMELEVDQKKIFNPKFSLNKERVRLEKEHQTREKEKKEIIAMHQEFVEKMEYEKLKQKYEKKN